VSEARAKKPMLKLMELALPHSRASDTWLVSVFRGEPFCCTLSRPAHKCAF